MIFTRNQEAGRLSLYRWWPRRCILALSLLCLVLPAARSNAFTVTFSEADFDTGWILEAFKDNPSAVATITPMATGGNPDKYIETTAQPISGTVTGYAYSTTMLYTPMSLDYIVGIDGSMDFRKFTTRQQRLGLGFRQNDSWYQGPSALSPTGWQPGPSGTGMVATDFTRATGAGPLVPNFSAGAAPIQFGFWFSNSLGSQTRRAGVDNLVYTLEIMTLPEPANYLTLFLVMAALGGGKYRRTTP